MSPKLTVLMGAGFSQSVGIPGTDEITRRLLAAPIAPIHSPRYDGIINSTTAVLHRALLSFYDQVNFELILHGAEALYTINLAGPGYVKDDTYKPVYCALMDTSPRWRPLIDESTTLDFIRSLVGVTIDIIAQASHGVNAANLKRAGTFIDELQSRFSIGLFSLNYDDLVERATGRTWFDGFIGDTFPRVFNAQTFVNGYREAELLCHLHGCHKFDIRNVSRTYEFLDNGSGRNTRATPTTLAINAPLQSGEASVIGPIISGLRKADKTVHPPFGYYNHALVEYLTTVPRLLIVGYGAQDSYINSWLMQFIHCHGSSARVGIITMVDETNENARVSLRRLSYFFGNNYADADLTMYRPIDDPLTIGSVIISAGGALASNDHLSKILDFLTR